MLRYDPVFRLFERDVGMVWMGSIGIMSYFYCRGLRGLGTAINNISTVIHNKCARGNNISLV